MATQPNSGQLSRKSGELIGDKYRLEVMIARGGMGAVWRALHVKLDTKVAIKFMDPELAEDDMARGRFEAEAKAAAKLRSPHVVQILDYGIDDAAPFIAMELLAGEDMRTRLRRMDHVPLDHAALMLVQACKALELAREAGIIHRDLKPANIFLARSGEEETVKVLDFGLAKSSKRRVGEVTKSGILLGSPHFMSPEQARGGIELDHRSDLWSMAAILFQMVTGKKPFPGDDLGEIILRICSEPLPVPSDVSPGLPVAIDRFFAKAFARDREERFATPTELARTFCQIVGEHLGRPELGSLSGTLVAPSGMRGPVSAEPAHRNETTLTHATRSIEDFPEVKRRPLAIVGAVAAMLAFGGAAAIVLLRSPASDTANHDAASAPDHGATAQPLVRSSASAAGSVDAFHEEPSDAEPRVAATSTASAGAGLPSAGVPGGASTAAGVAGSASATPPPKVVTPFDEPPHTAKQPAPPRPAAPSPPAPRPPAPSEHPVLGF